MKRFVEGECRDQSVLFPERLDDWIVEENPVRAVDAFVDELDFGTLGFDKAELADTGRPAYHPGTLLKIYIYGYLNRVQSSRRLEREAQRNVELMWLTGRLAPDFKTIADFRRDNGPAIRKVCAQFVELCRNIGLFRLPRVGQTKCRSDNRLSLEHLLGEAAPHINGSDSRGVLDRKNGHRIEVAAGR